MALATGTSALSASFLPCCLGRQPSSARDDRLLRVVAVLRAPLDASAGLLAWTSETSSVSLLMVSFCCSGPSCPAFQRLQSKPIFSTPTATSRLCLFSTFSCRRPDVHRTTQGVSLFQLPPWPLACVPCQALKLHPARSRRQHVCGALLTSGFRPINMQFHGRYTVPHNDGPLARREDCTNNVMRASLFKFRPSSTEFLRPSVRSGQHTKTY